MAIPPEGSYVDNKGNVVMKWFLRCVWLVLLLAAAGCAVEGPPVYGGTYSAFYGEYPYPYYDDEWPGPVFIEPYPYEAQPHWHRFDRDRDFDRRFERGHRWNLPPHFQPHGHSAPRSGERPERR
jgi:hypothetical protein